MHPQKSFEELPESVSKMIGEDLFGYKTSLWCLGKVAFFFFPNVSLKEELKGTQRTKAPWYKEYHKSPEIDSKEMAAYEISGIYFKITVVTMFNILEKWHVNKMRTFKKK